MNGRTENKIKVEKKIINKIKSYDNEYYLIGFYNFISAKYEYKTKELYINYVIKFLDTVNKYVIDIDQSDINNYLTELIYKNNNGNLEETSGTYRATVHSALKLYFTFLFDSNFITINPMGTVPRPKRKKDNLINRVYLKPNEMQIMINNVKNSKINNYMKKRDLLMMMVFLYTGIRCTALTEINEEDFDIQNKTLTVIDKRNKKRIFEIDDDMINLYLSVIEQNKIKKWKTNALFVSTHGTRISPSNVAKLIDKYTSNIDKHITPHKLRRSFGKNMYNETGDIYAVKAALGHENIQTTQLYVDMDDTESSTKGMIAMKKNVKF